MPDAAAQWLAPYRVDLLTVLSPFIRGKGDPATQVSDSGTIWRACHTPDGAGTLALGVEHASDGSWVEARGWGDGAQWLVDSVPSLLGGEDDDRGFNVAALPPAFRPAWQRLAKRWRVPRSRLVVEALVIAVLEQKVTGVESRRAWRSLLTERGHPAPGPVPRPMHVLPDARSIRGIPSWQWHRWGVQPPQSAALMRALETPGRLEQCADLTAVDARRRLESIPGIGPWTVSEVAQRALGDADAVSVGDYHLAKQVVFAFTAGDPGGGVMNGTDDQMLELLEPFAGHRYRVQRLVEQPEIPKRPARGPRLTINDHRGR